MKALVTNPPGGWEQTQLAEVPEPVASLGEVIVEIRAAGLNPADYYQVEGNYPGGPTPPFITGRDAAGVVVSGDTTGQWPPGTAVVVLQNNKRNLAAGTFCERQRFPADALALLPKGWSFEEGAASPLVYLTAWRALVECGKLTSDQTVVITGASGGVGSATVQLAAGLGARVIALSRSEAKRTRLTQIGARHIFAPDADDLKNRVFTAIGQRGVDLVVDTVGGPSLTTAVHLLGRKGKVVVLGVLGGAEGTIPIPSLMFKEASVHGIVVSDFTPSQAAAAWKKIVEVLGSASSRPIIDSWFPLADYRKAFERLAAAPFGKVVLRIDNAAPAPPSANQRSPH